ncbi:MAG: hypothetical protein DRP09_16795 [Candidatus Thorarchaeota archaeon]|nr:MAG: hypothetical protein DRP09_16795 [Candidatus Thorarchaeota archaeon]
MEIREQVNKAVIEFRGYFFSRTARQTVILYASQILLIVLRIATSSLNTRILGPKDYGVLAFFGTVTGFSVLFFRFGLFSSIGLLLAQEKDKGKEQELIGAAILIGLLVGISYSLFIFTSSFFIDNIFRTNINHILRIFSPILVILPFQMLIPQISRGTNKIYHLAWFNIIPRCLYIIGVVSILVLGLVQIKVPTLILINLIGTLVGVMVISCNFKPLFNNLKENFKKIWQKNKEYGIHLYWGQIADQSTYKLDGVLISYFVNTTQLGFYSLANALTSPLAMLSQSLSTSLFKSFASKKRIPKRVIQLNFLWLLAGAVGLVLFGRFIVVLLFTDKFLPVVPLILPLALAAFFQGMYQPYSMFFGAQGKGKWKRNMSIVASLINVIGNVILVPVWGALGAAVASFLSRATSYALHIQYYRRFLREDRK